MLRTTDPLSVRPGVESAGESSGEAFRARAGDSAGGPRETRGRPGGRRRESPVSRALSICALNFGSAGIRTLEVESRGITQAGGSVCCE